MGSEQGSGNHPIAPEILTALEQNTNHYNIIRRLGKGGHAKVYLVESNEEFYAAKVVCRPECSKHGQNFDEMCELLSLESEFENTIHDHLIRVKESIKQEDVFIVILEYAAGGSLADRIRQEPMRLLEVVQLGVDLCEGLIELHKHHGVHTDLKPDNILFDEKMRPMIADLGTIQPNPTSIGAHTKLRRNYGTEGYRSPEQRANPGQFLSFSSDLYQLGCILYEALTAKRYSGKTDDLNYLEPDARRYLGSVMRRMLAEKVPSGQREEADRKFRYGTAELALIDLKKVQESIASGKKQITLPLPKIILPNIFRQERNRLPHEPCAGEIFLEPRHGILLSLVEVSGGEFYMGSKLGDLGAKADEMPYRKINTGSFWISKYPITRQQYAVFQYETIGEVLDNDSQGDLPMEPISWIKAVEFCRWMSETTKSKIWLPTEVQWEKAARGDDGRVYPWGPQRPTAKRCNFNQQFRGLTPVGQFSPFGDSPYGCADMAGNVWEWTCTQEDGVGIAPGEEDFLSPSARLILKGGSCLNGSARIRCAGRLSLPPSGHDWSNLGLRIVKL